LRLLKYDIRWLIFGWRGVVGSWQQNLYMGDWKGLKLNNFSLLFSLAEQIYPRVCCFWLRLLLLFYSTVRYDFGAFELELINRFLCFYFSDIYLRLLFRNLLHTKLLLIILTLFHFAFACLMRWIYLIFIQWASTTHFYL
jgi:hypothetical protein